jgi:hypothetical protein
MGGSNRLFGALPLADLLQQILVRSFELRGALRDAQLEVRVDSANLTLCALALGDLARQLAVGPVQG